MHVCVAKDSHVHAEDVSLFIHSNSVVSEETKKAKSDRYQQHPGCSTS